MKRTLIIAIALLVGLVYLVTRLLPKGDDTIYISSYSSGRYLLHLNDSQKEGTAFLYPTGNPIRWAPSGRWLASIEYGNDDIVFYDLLSFREERMRLPETQEYDMTWSPGGDWIVLATGFGQEPWANRRLVMVDVSCLADSKKCDFLGADLGRGTDPDWSPAEDKLLFVRDRKLYLLDLVNKRVEALDLGLSKCQSPKWSPDGSRFLVVCETDIYMVSLDGREKVNLTAGIGKNSQPSWTPDGYVLFLSSRDEMLGERIGDSGNYEMNALYIMDPTHGSLRRLTGPDDSIFWYSWLVPNPAMQLRLFLP